MLLTQPKVGCSFFSENNARWLLGPRTALAWDPFGDGKTALRAGFGLYYSMNDDLAFWSGKNPPFNQNIQLSNAAFPFPPIKPGEPLPGAQVSPSHIEPNLKTPSVVAYNFRIEQGVTPNLAFSVAYSGYHSYHDLVIVDRNQVRPTICSSSLGNCPAGLADGSKYYPAVIRRANPLLAADKTLSSLAYSNYNAFLFELTRRFSQGLTFRANYTFGKILDINSSTAGIANRGGFTLYDNSNPRLDWGPANFDVRNRFSFSGSYELPIGKGKPFLAHLGRVADTVVGGWQLNSILNLQDGFPFDLQLGFNQSRNGDNSLPDRPSWNRNFTGKVIPGTVQTWYDPTAFIVPLAGTYGNLSRGSLRGPGMATLDFSLFKQAQMSERLNLQFRVEGFNLFNRTNLNMPNLRPLNPNGTTRGGAGQITRTSTTSRQIQLGMKLIF